MRALVWDGATARVSIGSVDIQSLISAQLPLHAAVEALQLASSPGVLKVLISPES